MGEADSPKTDKEEVVEAEERVVVLPPPSADCGDGEPTLGAPDVTEEYHDSSVTEIIRLQAELEDAQARLRTVSKAYRDVQEEMKQFRERTSNQSMVKLERQAFDLASTFFDPVMNLRRSLSAPADDMEVLVQGLNMVNHQFMEALTKLGLEEIPGEGAPFDPNVHEALAITPVTDESQDGRIISVHAIGYTIRGKVLRAAQVVIGKYQEVVGEA